MIGYVVRSKAHQYVHAFNVGTDWVGGECRAVARDVRWTRLQRLAFRWSDRNCAAGVASDLDAHVVRLAVRMGAPGWRCECVIVGGGRADGSIVKACPAHLRWLAKENDRAFRVTLTTRR